VSNRRIVVEAAFGLTWQDTIPSGAWVPLVRSTNGQTRAKTATWSIGRDDELEQFPPGTATILLWDRDRHLDPDNPASPYAGDLVPLTPVRIRSQNVDTLVYQDEFYGYVEGGWEWQGAPKETSDRKIQLIDLLGVLGGRKLPDVFDHAVMELEPVGYWVLDDSEEEVPDRAGTNDGLFTGNISTGALPVLDGDRQSADFAPDSEIAAEANEEVLAARVTITRSPLVASPTNITWMATFRARRGAHTVTNARILVAHTDGNGPGHDTGAFAYITPTNRLCYVRVVNGAGLTYQHAAPIIGPGHVFFGQTSGIAVDTATLTTTSVSGQALHPIGVNIGGGPGVAAVQHWDGWIGTAAIFDYALSTGNRQTILDASVRLAGQKTNAAVTWALDRLGVPAGLRNIDTGTVVLPPVLTEERDVLEFLRDVTATEGGDLRVDHRDGGKIRFTNRYNRFLATRSTVNQATFSDDPDATGTVRYPPEGLEVAPNGLDGIINEVTATWGGDAEVIVRDDDSIDAYGPRSRQIDTIGPKALAQSAAEWLLRRYKNPRSRVRGVTASRRTTYSRDDNVQALRIDDLVSLRVHPLRVGAASTMSLFVDGVTNTADDVTWETSFRFAQVDTFDPWIWGTSQWGSTTVWG
jgi:hypothetical protein